MILVPEAELLEEDVDAVHHLPEVVALDLLSQCRILQHVEKLLRGEDLAVCKLVHGLVRRGLVLQEVQRRYKMVACHERCRRLLLWPVSSPCGDGCGIHVL